MDLFWLIPGVVLVIAFLGGFYVCVRRKPSSPSTPQVLVDKPSEEPPMDEASKARDWSGRPCGSYLDWLFDRD
jgi:hypothetical protein